MFLKCIVNLFKRKKKPIPLYTPTTTDVWEEHPTLLLIYINEYRAAHNLNPLIADDFLYFLAEDRAEDIADIWLCKPPENHKGIDKVFSTLKEYGVAAGENIAWGFRTPLGTLKGWKNSPSHDSIMLDPKALWAGIGIYDCESGRRYWVLLTGRQLK